MLQYSLALLAVIALTPLRAQSTPTARRLRPGVAGEIPVGITVDSLYTIVGRERTRLVDLQQEGYFTPVIEIRSQAGGSRAMQAHIAATACGFLISRVDVFDPTYRTESGLHVGMTLADVRSRHSVELSAEEGAHALVAVLGMALELSSDSGADSTRVIAIRVDGPAVLSCVVAQFSARIGSPSHDTATHGPRSPSRLSADVARISRSTSAWMRWALIHHRPRRRVQWQHSVLRRSIVDRSTCERQRSHRCRTPRD